MTSHPLLPIPYQHDLQQIQLSSLGSVTSIPQIALFAYRIKQSISILLVITVGFSAETESGLAYLHFMVGTLKLKAAHDPTRLPSEKSNASSDGDVDVN